MLQHIPMPVLYGVFLFMGVSSLKGIQVIYSLYILLISLINDCSLARCDDIVPSQKVNTYVNHSLKQESCIDYILVSKECYVNNFMAWTLT